MVENAATQMRTFAILCVKYRVRLTRAAAPGPAFEGGAKGRRSGSTPCLPAGRLSPSALARVEGDSWLRSPEFEGLILNGPSFATEPWQESSES
jgi:hypothetical protein